MNGANGWQFSLQQQRQMALAEPDARQHQAWAPDPYIGSSQPGVTIV